MNDTIPYIPPKVWTPPESSGGRFANINRPVAGATHDKELPVGKHPLQLYSLGTPNGVKVTVMLEELLAAGPHRRRVRRLAGPHQRGRAVRQRLRGDQPQLQDPGAGGPQRAAAGAGVRVRRHPAVPGREVRRLPAHRAGLRAPSACRWLFWQMGSAPYLGGGFGHFYAYAPEKIEYAIDRYAMEVKRQMDVLDRRLAETPYVAGDELHHRRHGHLALVRALAKGLRTRPASSCRCTPTRTWCAGPSACTSAPPCAAAAWSTACRATPPASCTSATTPAMPNSIYNQLWC
jgi:GST-like protein